MAVEHKELEIVRDYKSLLKFDTGTFKDQVTSNSWSIVGSGISFNKFDSIFNTGMVISPIKLRHLSLMISPFSITLFCTLF